MVVLARTHQRIAFLPIPYQIANDAEVFQIRYTGEVFLDYEWVWFVKRTSSYADEPCHRDIPRTVLYILAYSMTHSTNITNRHQTLVRTGNDYVCIVSAYGNAKRRERLDWRMSRLWIQNWQQGKSTKNVYLKYGEDLVWKSSNSVREPSK